MKGKILLFIGVVFSQLLFCQQEKNAQKRTFIPIKSYKSIKKINTVNLDSVEFIINRNDTLIRYNLLPKNASNIYIDFDYRDPSFLRFYNSIAFYSKKQEDSLKSTMKYWRNDIKIYFGPNVSRKLTKAFTKFTSTIDENVDSLSISVVKKMEKSNFIVYTSEDYNYGTKLINSKKSSYWIYWNGKNEIYKAFIKLHHKKQFNDNLKLDELKKLFLQSLGNFRFDKRLDCRHSFANCYSPKKELTKLDLEILQYHYSYGICKGINLQSYLKFHEQANKIKAKGETLKIMYTKKSLRKN